MIYLVDDKKNRQVDDFGWTVEKFQNFDKIVQPIYSLNEITESSEKIFKEGNVVIYHESFIDNTLMANEAAEKRNKLLDFAHNNPNFYLTIFSGSKVSRVLEGNVAYLPVSIVYQNLEVFIRKYSEGDSSLDYLLFGENPHIESVLLNKLNQALLEIDSQPAELNQVSNLFLRPVKDNIQDPIENADIKTLFNDVSDEKFTSYINEWLSEKRYDNIFIPVSFGPTLSDFNGLRLAAHIRCTPSASQLSNIIIYSYVDVNYLVDSDFFNILKTKNVFLVTYSKKGFEDSVNSLEQSFSIEELPKEAAKLKLDPPKNYEDSHSVVNEWAIFQWANIIDAEQNDELKKVFKTVETNLFFKYLKTIYPVSPTEKLSKHELKIDYSGNPRILLIDDESHKGWYELFAYLLGDINNIYTDYIGDDFKKLSKEQIIDQSIQKIKDDDIDVVILDFRLHPEDFNCQRIQYVTGIQILKEIKRINPGIQVIVFSATNKVWNLKLLQEAGADGFIIKGSLENSAREYFDKELINDMINSISERLGMFFLKEFYEKYEIIRELIIPRKNFKNVSNPLPKEFVDETLKWYKLSIDMLSGQNVSDSHKTSSFLFMFSVLENISNRVVNIDDPIHTARNNKSFFKYEFRGTSVRLRSFIEDKDDNGYYRKTKNVLECGRNIPWFLKILNTIDFITEEKLSERELSRIIKKRNDFIHANQTTGDKFEISLDDLIWLNDILYKGLRNIF